MFFQQGRLAFADPACQHRAVAGKAAHSGYECLIVFALGQNHFAKAGAQPPLCIEAEAVQGVGHGLRAQKFKGFFGQHAALGNFRKDMQKVGVGHAFLYGRVLALSAVGMPLRPPDMAVKTCFSSSPGARGVFSVKRFYFIVFQHELVALYRLTR